MALRSWVHAARCRARSRTLGAWSRRQGQVATSFPCLTPSQVATSKPGRHLQQANPGHLYKPSHDLKTRSRPQATKTRSRPQIDVATSLLPTVGFPGRGTRSQVATYPHCHPCRDIKSVSRHRFPLPCSLQVATPNLMSRPGTNWSEPQPGHDTKTRSRPGTLENL